MSSKESIILSNDINNFDFQKVMQKNVQQIIQPILYENQFRKYGKNKYAREADKLIQIIRFNVGKYKLKAFAMYFPLFLPRDDFLCYGTEITNNFHLLNGNYFSSIYEEELFNKEIQLQHYKERNIVNFLKLVPLIKEGILPEMNMIHSLDSFMKKFESQEVYFFKHKFQNNFLNHAIPKSIVSIYHFLKGGQIEQCVSELEALKNEFDKDFANYIEKLLCPSENELVITEKSFLTNFHEICYERRKKYKVLK